MHLPTKASRVFRTGHLLSRRKASASDIGRRRYACNRTIALSRPQESSKESDGWRRQTGTFSVLPSTLTFRSSNMGEHADHRFDRFAVLLCPFVRCQYGRRAGQQRPDHDREGSVVNQATSGAAARINVGSIEASRVK